MAERSIERERAQNLWTSFLRKVDPLARAAHLSVDPDCAFEQIGGLAAAKDELLTYACAATSPEVYEHWGTQPPSGLLMIGKPGAGKALLARALATRTQTGFLTVEIPRLVIDIVHNPAKVGELVQTWQQVLEEMPALTVFFNELEFSQAQEIGHRRPDLPIGPIMDFLLEIVGRTIATQKHLVVGATGHPDTLRPAFVAPGVFERVVEVTPVFPADVIAALQIHAARAEKRAGRPLFDDVDWTRVVGQFNEPSTGDWVRILHAVLRRKARCEAAGESVTPVTTQNLRDEVERFRQAQKHIYTPEGGNYL